MKPEIKNSTIVAETKFLEMKKVHYINKEGEPASWDMVSRKNDHGIVMIVPFYQDFERLVLIKEFRVPINDYEWGFPAGLIEEGESLESAIGRELKEETGLQLDEIIGISPQVFNSAGLTDESIQIAFVRVSGTISSINQESSEDIETYIYSRWQVRNLLKSSNVKIGAKAWLIMSSWTSNIIQNISMFSM